MRLYPLSIIICGLFDFANTLQIFGGTSTEITCSAAAPSFSLQLIGQEMEYNSYDEFPGLFDVAARQLLSPTGNKAILYINGTNRSNNVTIMCRNYNLSSNQFHILFRLTLEFIDILPAPNDVYYNIDPEDIPGYLQILWEPPTLDSYELDSQNDSVQLNARIINYTVYITAEESTVVQVYNASETSFAIGIDKIPCSFWFEVAAVNPAGVGERSPPQNLTLGLHTGCIDSTSSTTDMIIEPISASSALSAGEITAVIVGVVLIIAGLLVMLAIIFAKLRNDRHQRIIQSLKSELRSDQLSNPTEDSVAEIDKCMESDHCSSGNDPSITDKKQQSDSTPTRSYSQDGPPLHYAEIDVLTKKQNKIPEPSSTEETSHHVYAILEQLSSPQIADTDQEKFNDDDDNPDLQD